MARPNDKLVVRSRMIYKTKMKDGEVEKYRCRLTASGLWQIEGVHFSPTPATVLIRIHLVTAAAANDGELRHFDAEEALLETRY